MFIQLRLCTRRMKINSLLSFFRDLNLIMESLEDLSKFLGPNNRLDVKAIALNELLGLTGSKEGCDTIQNDSNILKMLFRNINDKNPVITKTVCLILVNICATPEGAEQLINADSKGGKEILIKLLNLVLDSESVAADAACMTLSNITRVQGAATLLLDCMCDEEVKIHDLINNFCKTDYNSKGCNLHYLGPLFSNLSQCSVFRREIMNKNGPLIQKILPFIHYESSIIRRGGIVATVKNCCFDIENHELLLSSEVDVLPYLLLPLAGPEEFDDDDMDKLPLELQYLGDEKKRETDKDIRKLLLEAINQLCAKRSAREYMREKNVYVILREYHKWEKDRSLLLACENIVDILIRTEDEIGEDNLKSLKVPEEYVAKFEEMDKEYLKEN